MTRASIVIVAVLAVVPQLAGAQSLADVARAEEARRKSVPKATKVYTNLDLMADFTRPTSPAPAPPAPGAAESASPAPGAPPATLPGAAADTSAAIAGVPGTEAQWRGRITEARATLERSRVFADALQSRINGLNADIVNRDDPFQRAALEQDRQKALAELERVKAEMTDQTQAIARIEEEARRAGVPPGWLR